MNLVDVVTKLGDKNYAIGRPIYFSGGGDEQEYVRVHAKPALKMGMPELLEQINRDEDSRPPGIAIAYGGFIGIDVAVAQGAQGVLLLDNNPDQKHFWRATIELIRECPTAADFNARFSRLSERYDLRPPAGDVEERYPSFTSNEAVYKVVHDWATSGMMAATDMDALDAERHQRLAEILQKQARLSVSTIFLTNVPFFYSQDRTDGKFAPRTDFYSGKTKPGDYAHIFENQGIIAGKNTRVVYADTSLSASEFPLKQEKLGAILERFAPPAAAQAL